MCEPLKHYLSESGVTQAQLGEQLGVRQETVSKWIRGVKKIPVERVPRLSEITRIPRIQLRPDKPDLFG